MTRKVDYYAILNEGGSLDNPSGVFRRVADDAGESDEAFTHDLVWRRSSALYAAERGDLQYEFVPISEEEAMRIVERIRREVAGQ